MERRVLIAIFLSFIVLYAYQALVVKPTPKPASQVSSGVTAGEPASAASATNPPLAPNQTPAGRPAAPPLVGEAQERDVRVETRDVIAVFTNRGARLKSWRLKHYLDQVKQPQELIETELPAAPLPFTLQTPEEQVTATINGAIYSVSGVPSGIVESPVDLRFEYRDQAGVRAVKTFHLEPSSYLLTFLADVGVGDRALPVTVVWGPALGDIGEVTRGTQTAEGFFYQADGVTRLAPGDIAKQPARSGDFRYVGVDDNYFMTVAVSPGESTVVYEPVSIPSSSAKGTERSLIAYSITPKRQGTALQFFIGPKDFDLLTALDHDLATAVNFGRFAIIVVPLYRSLKWVHGYIGNWGWSIVVLTVIINAIMFPLRHKSVVSMRRMQEIQPEVKAIQERYAKFKATDPAKQKMNQELMALYRERGVNPAGGCVPMLLTFPILFAMWALLSTAVELRGAPFFGWIHDLTAHDPYFVTPIFMGATTVWQQYITPAAGVDPAQQKMMRLMPIVFTVMFLYLPAGVAIYYAMSNLWGIGQQYLTNYLIGPPPVHAVRPPAERRVKRVGAGKSEAADRDS
jgi:YidC/Oxa1 family membrane protein insertase